MEWRWDDTYSSWYLENPLGIPVRLVFRSEKDTEKADHWKLYIATESLQLSRALSADDAKALAIIYVAKRMGDMIRDLNTMNTDVDRVVFRPAND